MNAPAQVLPSPPLPTGLAPHAQWLAGEGAGSWFVLYLAPGSDAFYHMYRHAPHGELECRGQFMTDKDSSTFDISRPFAFTYPSHCARITVLQFGQVFTLIPVPNDLLS